MESESERLDVQRYAGYNVSSIPAPNLWNLKPVLYEVG